MSEAKAEELVGLYSPEAATLLGTVFWTREDGTEVEITAVAHPSNYLWDDKVIIGPVVSFSRYGTIGEIADIFSTGRRQDGAHYVPVPPTPPPAPKSNGRDGR